ncbi:hypothetical protein TVAG_366610 [Trichomonas vaginalis G3]|uniref:Uncharacterized protein n=1 Tax=Trichomonas vaginalis (strain ATCC PRA-98 / G3) TaxID=412133 RepID=A2FWF4_TRIV3|nr:armadillo (ARM) repeat-containing protein family [Trichomonas vaginalis G3]EAX90753.1 hypothetical protein TVAG_366610 [Trichomonas vaginalis G3]KAI5515820.1 armadillo (ARM) repeat-containing protein family [Trichomonas vaginalis G3]|eukprot:XP_001303683.1 hypothetical protein [Trichomonas vaginalis G3]
MKNSAKKFVRSDNSWGYETGVHIQGNYISTEWNQFITENKGNLPDILNDLCNFFDYSDLDDVQHFCTTYSLAELWNFFLNTKKDKYKIQILKILCNAINYKNESLSFLQQSEVIDILLQNLKASNEDLCDITLGVLSSLCTINKEIIPYLLSNGIINSMKLLSTLLYFGSMLVNLATVQGEHVFDLIELASLCIVSDYSSNVKSAFTVFGQLLSSYENDDLLVIKERIMKDINAYINNISEISDSSAAKEFFLLLSLFDEIPPEYSLVISTIINNCFELDEENISKAIKSGIEIFNHFYDQFPLEGCSKFYETILIMYDKLNIRCKHEIAQFLVNRFPYQNNFEEKVCRIFGEFMDDPEIGAKCIFAFTEMMENFKDNETMSALIVEYSDKIFDGINSEDENILEASIHFIDVLKKIQQ